MGYSRQFATCIALVVGFLLATVTVAQPLGTHGARGTDSPAIPESVVLNGKSASVKLRRLGPAFPSKLEGERPQRVPVFSTLADGSIVPGVLYTNETGRPCAELGAWVVDSIYLDSDGTYKARIAMKSLARACDRMGPGPFEPGFSMPVPKSDTAVVYYSDAQRRRMPNDDHVRGGFAMVRHTDVPPPPSQLQAFEDACNRVFGKVTRLLASNVAIVNAGVNFGALPGGDPLLADVGASTQTVRFEYDYFNVRTLLEVFAGEDGDNESLAERNVYSNLPNGNTVVVQYSPPLGSRIVSSILVPSALDQRWSFVIPGQNDFDITLNNTLSYYYTARDGGARRRENVSRVNFEQLLTHEIFHGLGFLQSMENSQQNGTFIDLWEVFRLAAPVDPPPAFISPQTFFSANRMLVIGNEASGVLYFGNFGSRRMSTGRLAPGDGYSGSHWKDSRAPVSTLALMDPFLRNMNDYPREADQRGLDIIGWNLEVVFNPLIFPQSPNQFLPPNQSAGQPLTVELEWTPGQSSNVSDVYVFRGSVIGDATEVFRQQDLLGGSTAIPAGVLQPGQLYSWFVTAVNDDGYAYSETWTFSTAGCRSDWDGSGAVNSSDTSAYLTSWLDDVNSGTLLADFDDSESTNSSDISAFLLQWNTDVGSGQCP